MSDDLGCDDREGMQGRRSGWFLSRKMFLMTGPERSSLPIQAKGVRHRRINTLLLWAEAAIKSFASLVWIMYDQAKLRGAHVLRGDPGCVVMDVLL